jgi:hypothetical protein
MAHNLLQTSANRYHFKPLDISGVSQTPAETNLFLVRGTPFNIGHDPKTPLRGFLPDNQNAQALPETCTMAAGCAVPPGEFCRQLTCPPLSVPFEGGCLGTSAAQDGSRVGILESAQ